MELSDGTPLPYVYTYICREKAIWVFGPVYIMRDQRLEGICYVYWANYQRLEDLVLYDCIAHALLVSTARR